MKNDNASIEFKLDLSKVTTANPKYRKQDQLNTIKNI